METTIFIQMKFSYSDPQFIQEYIALKIVQIRPELTSPAKVKNSLTTENKKHAHNCWIITEWTLIEYHGIDAITYHH